MYPSKRFRSARLSSYNSEFVEHRIHLCPKVRKQLECPDVMIRPRRAQSVCAAMPAGPAGAPARVEAMRAKIKAGGHESPYRLRKQLPEPVFGQIKQARGFRQFLLRGFEKVRAEWAIVCTVHNLLKLAQRRSLSEALS